MRKNISQLIVQVEHTLLGTKTATFMIPCKDIHKYENKILVEAEEYNTPSQQELFVEEQMREYEIEKRDGLLDQKRGLEEKMQWKKQKKITLDQRLTKLELKFNLLKMTEVMQYLRLANRKELELSRHKLMKLQNLLSFKLQNNELESHEEEALNQFLSDLNEIINKTSKVY